MNTNSADNTEEKHCKQSNICSRMSEMKPNDQISKAIPPETCHDTYSQLPAALRWVTATE